MAFEELTPEIVCEVLSKADLHLVPADVRVEAREERWVVRLPGRRLAWFAASNEGVRRLKTERRVLGLLHSRCTFGVPRIILEDAAGEFGVRAMVVDGDRSRYAMPILWVFPQAMIGRAREDA
jgi:hypothetical protein